MTNLIRNVRDFFQRYRHPPQRCTCGNHRICQPPHGLITQPWYETYQREPPRPIPQSRARCLSVSSTQEKALTLPSSPASFDQVAFPFFQLPAEIRTLIYSMVLANTPLHIIRSHPERLSHVRCRFNTQACSWCMRAYWQSPVFWPEARHNDCLSLMLVCRKLYVESLLCADFRLQNNDLPDI